MHNPFVPETLEGWSILHHMFKIHWPKVQGLTPAARTEIAMEAAQILKNTKEGHTGLVQLLGHKADLMIIYFRKSFEDLGECELNFAKTELSQYLEMTTSYVSVVELGLYEMTAKIHQQLSERSFKPGSPEFDE